MTVVRYVVRCEDYESQRYATRESAAKAARAADGFGACSHSHGVAEVTKTDLGHWKDA